MDYEDEDYIIDDEFIAGDEYEEEQYILKMIYEERKEDEVSKRYDNYLYEHEFIEKPLFD